MDSLTETNILRPIIQQRTHRKVTRLCKELDMKRKRLERFITGSIDIEDLTVAEYRGLQEHELFKDLLQRKSTGLRLYTIRRGVKFHDVYKRDALNIVEQYILPAYHAIGAVIQRDFPEGDYDLWFSYQVDNLITMSDKYEKDNIENDYTLNYFSFEDDAKRYVQKVICLNPEEQKIFITFYDDLCHADSLDPQDTMKEYLKCIETSEQLVYRNFVKTRKLDVDSFFTSDLDSGSQMKIDFNKQSSSAETH